MRKNLFTFLKVLVTVALIAFLVISVNPARLWGVLTSVRPLPLLLALGLYFLAIVIGAVKWNALVRAQGIDARLPSLLSFALVGLFFGNVLPSNVGGDVVRAYDLARATRGRGAEAAISVLVDRLMGLVANLGAAVLMAVLAGFMLAQVNQIEDLEIATVVVAGVFIAGLALLFSRRVSRRLRFLFSRPPLQRLEPLAKKVYDALQVYRFRYGALALNVSLSALIVVVTAVVWYLVGVAVGIDNVSFFHFLLFNPLIAFVVLVPISLNGLGPKELTAVFFFGLIGVPQEQALSMSLLFHVLIIATSLPGGLLWWRARGLAPESEQPTASGAVTGGE